MNWKRLILSIVISTIILYLAIAAYILNKFPDYTEAFNPLWQIDGVLFAFGWSLGTLGYVILAVLVILFIAFVYWLIGKLSRKKKANGPV